MFGSKKTTSQKPSEEQFSFSVETMEGKMKGQDGNKEMSANLNSPPQNLPGAEKAPLSTAPTEESPFLSQGVEQGDLGASTTSTPEPMTMQNLATPPSETSSVDKYKMPSSKSFSEEDGGEKRTNKILVIVAALVLIITIFVGAYYYFFVLKNTTQDPGESTVVSTPVLTPIQGQEQATNLESISTSSSEESASKEHIKKLTINEDLLTALKNYFTEIKNDPTTTTTLSNGYFLELDQIGKRLNSSEILKQLGVELDQSITLPQGSGWLFIDQEIGISAPLKIALILGYEQGKVAPVTAIKDKEKDLPIKLKALFIDESAPHIDDPSSIVFATSSLDDRIRFYNYLPGETRQSIDWGVIKNKSIDYLVITTSKDSTRKILDLLETADLGEIN